jgi:hypothetical protein
VPATRRTAAAVCAGLAVLALVLAWTAALRAPQISIFDEWTHADYAWQLAHGHLPAAGSVVAPEILADFSCRSAANGVPLPPCGQPDPPAGRYPFRGENYNFAHPPLYYAVTAVVTRGIDAAVPGQHFITIARLTGVGWLWAAMLTLYLALRRFGLPRGFAALGTALLPLCPGVLHAASTVTNDAPAALCGALALLLLARVLNGERVGWLLPTGAALLAAGTKVLNALPFLLLAAAFVVLAAWSARRGSRPAARELLLAAAGIGLAVLCVHLGWSLFQAGRGLPGWSSPVSGVHTRPLHGLPAEAVLPAAFTGFPLQDAYYLQPALDGAPVAVWARALSTVFAAAPFLALAAFARRSAGWLVGAVTLGGLLVYPVLVQLQSAVGDHRHFVTISSRYGMSLVPWAIGCLALVAWRRGALRLGLFAAAVGGATMLGAVSGLL